MFTCQICKRGFKSLMFHTEDIGICTRCVNSLNNTPEPAVAAMPRLGDMLARGMERNVRRDLLSENTLVTACQFHYPNEFATHAYVTNALHVAN